MKKFFLFIIVSVLCAQITMKAQTCISNVFVETVACEPDGTFTGLLFFESPSSVDSVAIFYNQAFFGYHSTVNLPIVLSPLFGNGAPHIVEVQDQLDSTCTETLIYTPICEFVPTCSSEILSASSFCVDSIFNITVNYNFIDPLSEVHIRVNGEYVTNGVVGQNISQSFTVPANPNNVYEIQVLDPELTDCSDIFILQASSCLTDCIQEFDPAGANCNTDGTYDLNFFLGENLGAANVYIDGQLEASIPANDSIDFYTLEELISDSISTSHEITVCLQSNPSCCTTYTYDDPMCPMATECDIEIFNAASDCNQEGLFIDINYSYENPFSEAHVYVNGQYYSNADAGVDKFIGIFIPNPELIEYVIEIRDAEMLSCSDTYTIQNTDCDPCEVFQFSYSWDCDPDGTFHFSFENNDPLSPVSVYLDSVLIGTHTEGMPDLIVDGLDTSGGTPILISICSDIYDCCTENTFLAPDCADEGDCSITDPVLDIQCLPGTTDFIAALTFDYTGVDTVKVVDYNGNVIGFYSSDQQPIIIQQPTDPNQSTTFGVVIYNASDEQCVTETPLFAVPCSDFCQIYWIEYDVIDCNPDGTYNAEIFYGLESNNAQFVIAAVNGNIVDSIAVSTTNSFVLSNITPTPGTNVDMLTLCIEGYPNCCYTVELQRPICEPTDCFIGNNSVEYDCIGNGEYIASVVFETENTSGELHYFIDGNFIGSFDDTQNLFAFGPFENGTPHFYTIQDVQNEDCAIVGDIFWQECPIVSEPCIVDFIEVDSFNCNVDGTYNMGFTFGTTNETNDLVDVTVNGVNIDVYVNNGFLSVSNITPRPNSDFDIIEICVNDNPDCCKIIEYIQPDCGETDECNIEIASIDYECISEGEYEALITFTVDDSTSVYQLFIDGEFVQSFNNFNYYSTTVGPFANATNHTFTIVDLENPNCVFEGELFTQECVNVPCSVDFIEVDSLGCNNNGTYDLSVSFGTSNSFYDFVDVSVNGEFVDVFNNNGFLFLEEISPRPNSDFDIIEICVNDNPNCCLAYEYLQPVCNSENACSINIVDIVYECTGNTGRYEAYAQVETENISGLYNILLDGLLFNIESADQNLIPIGTFPNGTGAVVTIEDRFNTSCFAESDIFWQECPLQPELCTVDFIEVDSVGCNIDGTYDMIVSYEVSNPTNNQRDISINGVSTVEFTNFGDIIEIRNITPRSNSDFDIITICVNDNPNCCATIEYQQPNCNDNEDCSLEEIGIDYECLGNGEYLAYISFAAENSSDDFELFIDGEFLQVVQGGPNFIEVGPFENGTFHEYFILDAQYPDCTAEGDIFTQECIDSNEPCNIEFIEILETSCNDDGTFDMDVLYVINSPGNNFIDVFLNGEFFGFYDIDSLVTLEDIPLSLTNEVKTITICVNDNPDCCMTIDYNQPECGNDSECELDDLVIEYECNEDTGEIIPLLFFKYNADSTNEVIVNVDGINIGFFDPNQQPLVLDAIMSNSADVWNITVIDALDDSCFTTAVLEDVDCGGTCIIADITFEEECLGDGTVLIYLDFFSNNTSGDFTINGNGTQYGTFDINQLPIELGPFTPSDNDVWEFVVTDVNLNNCSNFIEIEELGCNDINEIECLVENIEVYNIDCIGGNEYSMSVNFEIPGNSNIPFTFYHNGAQVNSTATSSLPLNLIGLVPNDSIGVEVITICLDAIDNCCFDFEYETPSCFSNSIDLNLLDGVNLSPNPTRDIVNINHIPQEVIGLKIIDNLGRSIRQLNASEDMQLDVSNFAEGIYTVQFFTADNKVMNMRFVKMN